RGLATLAKAESSYRAARLGITRIVTSNDLDNAPMLAINRKLGFAETAVIESYAKRLAPRGQTRAIARATSPRRVGSLNSSSGPSRSRAEAPSARQRGSRP